MDLQFDASFAENPGQGGGTITGRSPFSDSLVLQRGAAGNPRWYADDVRAPGEVAPGGVVDVAVDMVNKDRVVTPLNPNVCRDGSFSGLEAEITIDPSWTSPESVTDCLGITTGINPTRRTHEFGFEAPPAPGTYSIDVSVIATGDGSGGTDTIQVVVPETGDSDPRPGTGDGGDGGGDGGGDDGDGSNPIDDLIDSLTFGTDSAAVPLVILVVILVALLYLTAI